MMKAMLKKSGVLAICIDDRELYHLGMLLDEIFGEDNRIGIINWQKSYSPRNDNTHISTATVSVKKGTHTAIVSDDLSYYCFT